MRTASYKARRSWADTLNTAHYQSTFAGFMRLWADEVWREVVHTAIHWYVEANAQAGSVEGRIVSTQTAFELLSSFILVEREGWVAEGSFQNLPAADRIRLLLRWAGLPTDVPACLAEVTKLALGQEAFKLNGRPDSAAAMTTIRNTITHPTRKNREKFGNHPAGARSEVWSLGLWALELCLLRMFGHTGTYANRLTQRYRGEVDALPWTAIPPRSASS